MRTFALTMTLLAAAAVGRADDADPEPPGGGATTLRKLKGKWTSVRRILKGREVASPGMYGYLFDGDKVTYSYASGKSSYVMRVEPDRKRPDVVKMTREKTVAGNRWFFKIEKGELYITVNRSDDPKAKPDFSGDNAPVIVYKQEK